MTDYPTDLSYACIDVKPIDYTFTGDRWAEGTDDGSGWRVCFGTIIPGDLETTVETPEGTFELDTDDHTIWDEDNECHIAYDEDRWAEIIDRYFDLDADDLRAQIDGEDHDQWEPMMSYAYPLDGPPPDDWKAHVTSCTCVEIDGAYYLALTGGGMDLSWEICESYMRLGYYPPAHFARLPSMCGRGTSERDRWIIEGCRKSLQGIRDRAERSLHALDEMVEWAKEDAAERAARQAKA